MGILNKFTGNLKNLENKEIIKKYGMYISEKEIIAFSFELVRDIIIFTNKRIVTIDKQGSTGKKKEITSIFNDNITNIMLKTANVGIDDHEVIVYYKAHKTSRDIIEKQFEFTKKFEVDKLYKHLIDSIYN